MKKTITSCCALCQINDVNNETPKELIEKTIQILTKEKNENTEVGITTGRGQTAAFIIVSPGESILENNIITLGFELKHEFERRRGYPNIGNLKMYIKNL